MIQVSCIIFYFALYHINCKSLEHRHGLDIISNTNYKIYAADAFLAKKLYFVIIQDNGRSLLKTTNFTRIDTGKMQDVLKYPVQSAESVAVDWVNGNLYWADQKNQFIEVVDLNGGLNFPIPRNRRRILFSRSFGDIYSLVVDPWEQYIFWLQVGAFLILERARLDGSDRRMISSKPFHFKSSRLAIDRHRKMLFWWGLDGVIHRVDYQGQTGCKMQLEGDWKNWNPSYFTFAEGKLIFISEDQLWASTFQCGSGTPMMLNTNNSMIPAALIATKYQLTIPGGKIPSRCVDKVCSSICLPTVESNYRCACMTGIDIPIEKSICPKFPTQSLFIGSPPKIYQISLDGHKQPLELLSEQAGIPFRFAYDSMTSSLLYVDFNSSSILSLDLNQYGPPQKLILDFPILSEVPVSIAIDSTSRNIYWMNHRNSEVWVARISRFNRLKYATLLLSWLPNTLFRDTRNQHDQPPGELAVDSINHYLFVTVIGDGACSIERYWLDGSHKYTVISSNNNFCPRGLTLDENGQKIYFMDSERDQMICIDYKGQNKRVISGKFQEFFGLSYYDNFIYWTEMEALSIHVIKSDGSLSSVLMKTRNLDARTMPIIAVSRNMSMDIDSPCHDSSNKCDQLCFPTPGNKISFSCGCSNPAHILLNLTPCTYSSEMIVYYNKSTVVIHQLAPNINKQNIVLGNENSEVRVGSLHTDHFRNQIYWIDKSSNCVMKTANNIDIKLQWKIFCLTSDIISNIGLDAVRNNLYVSVISRTWTRIVIIRLPFYYSDYSSISIIVSIQNENKFLGAVAVHSDLKFMFWFEAQSKDRFSTVEIYQAYLDGSVRLVIWEGMADIEELTVDDQAHHICWKYSVKGKIYKYDIVNKKLEIFQLSSDILNNQVNISSPEWLHVYSMMQYLYLFVHDSLYHVNLSEHDSLITHKRLKLVLHITNFGPVRGFSFVSRSSSALTKKVAIAKTNVNVGSVIMCPTSQNEVFVSCSQFCLPVKQNKCGCGSIYSLGSDGSTCVDSNDLILVMTKTGEIIGISGNIDNEKDEDLQFTEWIEVAEQQGDVGQKFIDAVYWLSRNIILRLDSHGYISAVDRNLPFPSIKKYKKLIVQEDEDKVNSNRKYNSNYDRIYKNFVERDYLEFKDHYISTRFSLAIDPNSGTLVWSDWINGVIVAERLNSQIDQIEFLGIIIDFRKSSRRPLQITIAPISSSLIWLSADLSLSSINETSIWRNFWIEMSDLDGSRRSVLTKDPGIPSCLTVDVDSGKIYWFDMKTNKLMYLNINWGDYQIRAGHVIGYKMKVTVDSLITTGLPLYTVGSYSSTMVILKKYLFWTDSAQQIFASTSINSNILKPFSEIGSSTNRTRIYTLPYLKNKLNGIVKIMARMAPQDFKISSLGTLLQNHPCSHAAQALTNKRCSHLCLSTIPIRLAEEYSYLMTEVQLADKFRCSCPLSMSVTHKMGHKFSVCVESQIIKCERYHIPCKAGLVFSKKEGMSIMSCMPIQQRCDSIEDCLDGSDEIGCNTCNSSHFYSCSGSGLCLPLNKRCNGIIDCDSDEKCCSSQKFECLSGKDSSRCLTISDRCNGIADCKDGSDEHNCNKNIKGGLMSSPDDYSVVAHINNNHTVAIIAGSIAISACSIAIIYIVLSRRYRRKTVHESCLFRANNVNIMFMSPSQKPSRRYRFSTPYDKPNASSSENLSHAKSCDIIDNGNNYNSDPTTQSLNSLSDCYRRIKNPHPCPCSILGRPLFSMHDDILFQLSRIRRQTEHCASNSSIKKIEKPPPSVVTVNSEEMEKPEDQIATNNEMMSRNSFLSSPCESELEEIYVHRYQVRRQPAQFENYPSCLLQNLLSACNQTPKLCNTPITSSRDLVVENVYRRRRRKLFKYRRPRKSSKANLSLSPLRRSRPDYSQNTFEFYHNSSSNLNISPPPPSPITVVSA